MADYEPFVHARVVELLNSWRNANVGELEITCGPLQLMGNIDIMHSVIHIVTHEGDHVQPGTFVWYEYRFYLFRCLYALVRNQGLVCPQWEGTDRFELLHERTLHEVLQRLGTPLRVIYPRNLNEELIVQNLCDKTYFKLRVHHVPAPPAPLDPASGPGSVSNNRQDNFIDLTESDADLDDPELGIIEEDISQYLSYFD